MRRGAGGSRPPRRLRVGFAGTGYIAEWHAKALASVAGADLVAVCDRAAPRAEAFARRFGVGSFHSSLEAMLSSESLDVVHVLLPPDVHFEAARTALTAGVNLLLEKPMAVRADDCDALVRAAASRGVTVGVSHNFLFAEPYERLRADVRAGRLGRLDHVEITWNRELPQATQGPFDLWMLREPGNMMLEIGSHSVAHLLDLVGAPDWLDAHGESPLTLPTGSTFYRRWRIDGARGSTGIDLRFSFVAGFAEHRILVRGTLGSAEVDLLRNTYVLRRHRPLSDDFDRYAMTTGEARDLVRQARRTLRDYVLGTLRLARRAGPYEASIARTFAAFYGGLGGSR